MVDPDHSTASDAAALPPDIIDEEIFGQLLEMDEEDDREFSKSIVGNYFEQAETTFKQMDQALEQEDLGELSTLGHFLKGSSAACGVIKVRDSCEYMQHYGKLKDERAVAELSRETALEKLKTTLADVKVQYKEAERALKKFYGEPIDDADEDATASGTAADPATPAAVADDSKAAEVDGKDAAAAATPAKDDAKAAPATAA